jgi:hypothetical protein
MYFRSEILVYIYNYNVPNVRPFEMKMGVSGPWRLNSWGGWYLTQVLEGSYGVIVTMFELTNCFKISLPFSRSSEQIYHQVPDLYLNYFTLFKTLNLKLHV